VLALPANVFLNAINPSCTIIWLNFDEIYWHLLFQDVAGCNCSAVAHQRLKQSNWQVRGRFGFHPLAPTVVSLGISCSIATGLLNSSQEQQPRAAAAAAAATTVPERSKQ
jgi:hypothetical protein